MALTIGDLRALLINKGLSNDTLVVLQKDSEGNGFSPLAGGEEIMYVADSTWSGQAYPTPEEIEASDYYDEDAAAPEDAERVLVLWPVN